MARIAILAADDAGKIDAFLAERIYELNAVGHDAIHFAKRLSP